MTEEQTRFLLQAKEELANAQRLWRDKTLRAAVSRAYYAMFYIAQVYLLEKELSFSKHSAVISAFGREITGKGLAPTRFHRALINAEALRGIADYDMIATVSEDEARAVVLATEEFVAEAERYFGSVSPHDEADFR